MPGDSPARGLEAIPGFRPETERERAVVGDRELREGLAWGRPRRGHPEGTVGSHVADLLDTIDRWGETGARREDLRFLALVHDSMKFRVRDWMPKTVENHHATRARRLAERYISDERRFADMVERILDLDLFVRFVELDGSTEGKNPAPVAWLKEELRRRGAWDG